MEAAMESSGGDEKSPPEDEGSPSSFLPPIVPLEVQDVDGLMQLNHDLLELLDVKNTLRTPPPSVNIPPLECHALQMEEIEVIRSIYGDDVALLNDDGTCFSIKIKFLSEEEIKEEDVIKLWFSLPCNYPCVPPVFEIEANQSGSFSYRDADDLFDVLMEACLKRAGQTIVFDLVTLAQDRMPDLVKKKAELAACREAEDKERQRQMEIDEALKSSKGATLPDHLVGSFMPESTTTKKESNSENWYDSDADRYGIKKPGYFIGSISDIMKKIPSSMQITRIENVMRQDIATRFRHATKECSEALWKKARDRPYLYNLEPQVAFHGTRAASLPSIVQQGLVIPGKDSKVEVRCGSSLGVGIYTSPLPDYSYCYSNTGRLVVCAVLLGQMYKMDSSVAHSHHYKYYSVISSCGSEWVLFSCAQVLPCYVIDVRLIDERGKSAPPPLQPVTDDHDYDESERDRKKRLLSRANKFLPFGFGPGKRTIIEDAASFDEDEEEYGDYQEDRYKEAEEACQHNVAIVETELQKYRIDGKQRTSD